MIPRQGVIFQSKTVAELPSWQVDEFKVASVVTPQKTKTAKVFASRAGYFLVILALVGGVLFYGPIAVKEIPKSIKAWLAAPARFGTLLKQEIQAEDKINPINTDFAIVIPKIKLNATVIANVDPARPSQYQAALKVGVAHAKGKVFPGMEGMVYLFDHSSLWPNAQAKPRFEAINELEYGDPVIVYYQGIKYVYKVTEKQILERSDTKFYYDSSPQKGILLQTCWPPGTSQKQLVVIGRPVT
jgi:sortase A